MPGIVHFRERFARLPRLGFALAILALAAPGALAQNFGTVITNNLFHPSSVAVSPQNRYVVTDSGNHRVIDFHPDTRELMALAGGEVGATDGPGAEGRFRNPQGIAAVPADLEKTPRGYLVADTGNHLIRLVTPSGVVFTVAGDVNLAGAGDEMGFPPANFGASDGPGAAATFYAPTGLAYDGRSTVYVADSLNGSIRALLFSDETFTNCTVSTLVRGLDLPTAVAAGADGSVYIADTGTHSIYVFRNGALTRIAGRGTTYDLGLRNSPIGTQALLNAPRGLLLREIKDELLVADTGNKVLRRIYNLSSPTPGIETFAGGSTVLDSPIGLARDQVGLFLIVDKGAHRLTSLTTTIKPRVADPIVGRVTFRVDPFTGIEIAEIERVVDAVFEETQLIVISGDAQGTHLFTSGAGDAETLDSILPPRPDTPGVNPALNFPSPSNRREAFKDAISIDPRPVLTLRAATYDLNDPERVPSRVVSGTFRFRCSAPVIETERVSGAVTFSCATTNVTIGYTLNGEVPDLTDPDTIPVSDLDNFSIPLPVGKTLKARAFRPGFAPSTVTTRSDFIPVYITLGFTGGEASSDFVGAPGQRFFAPITLLTPSRPSAYGLQFSLSARGEGASPEVDARSFGFTSMLEENKGTTNRVIPPAITVSFETNIYYDTNYFITNILQPGGGFVTVTNAVIEPFWTNVVPILNEFEFVNVEDRVMGVGWMEIPGQTNLYNSRIQDLIRFSRARDIVYSSVNGRIIPGAFSFQVPGTAPVGSRYTVSVDRSSATAAGNRDVYIQPVRPEQTTDTNNPAFGLVPAVRNLTLDTRWYAVGDVLPFRWLNAGDFGDTNVLNNDLQVLYQAVVYNLNLPPAGSDFADALDSCCVTTNDIDLRLHPNHPFSDGSESVIDSIAFGDGVLDISDIWVTYRRALDHTLKWYQRAWGRAPNGAPRRIARETPNVFREQIGRLSAAAQPAAGGARLSAFASAGQNLPSRLTLSLAHASADPGGWVEIPVTVRVDGSVPLRALLLNVLIEAADGGVPLVDGMSFTPSAALGAPSLLFNSISARLGLAWLETDTAGLLGQHTLGTIRFQIPSDAPANTIYRLRFDHVSGSPNGISLFPATTAAGCIVMNERPNSSWRDGISDVWRAQYFGSVRNPDSLADLDPDGDGVSNAAEFNTGTDPLDASDNLKVQLRTRAPRGVAIRWAGHLGKRYVLESSSLLAPGSWSRVTDPIDGNGGEIEIEQENSVGQRYYRIRLEEAP